MKAMRMVNVFSRHAGATALGAGAGHLGVWRLAGAGPPGAGAATRASTCSTRGFSACDHYANGEAAMAQVTCPVLFALGSFDQMTRPKAAQGLIKKAHNAQVVLLPGGHHQMNETPQQMLAALTGFLRGARGSDNMPL
jgi:pimeloyl-ACP methyl ester carboxylesterase